MSRNIDWSYMVGNQFAKGSGPNSTSFKAGQEPWNKGLKGWSPPGSKKTQFKKGERGNRYVAIGTISVRTDKNGAKRRWIKVKDHGRIQDRWQMYATWLWLKEKGPIPDRMFVHHVDGDSMHDSISNYALVNRTAHIALHQQQLLLAKVRDAEHPGKGFVRAK